MEENIIQSTVTPTISIVVNGEDAAGNPTTKKWKLCLDYRALARIEAETATKVDLKKPENWKDISSGEFPKVIWCCLGRYNPTVSLDDVIDGINPQAYHILRGALFELTFPWIGPAIAESEKNGGDSPNE